MKNVMLIVYTVTAAALGLTMLRSLVRRAVARQVVQVLPRDLALRIAAARRA